MTAKNDLNKLLRKIKGKPMTNEQKATLELLRRRVKSGELTIAEAKKIWNDRYHVWKEV